MLIDTETPVGTIATEHPLSTRVFARHGIDFCCGGGKPLSEACRSKGVDVAVVVAELETEMILDGQRASVGGPISVMEEEHEHIHLENNVLHPRALSGELPA